MKKENVYDTVKSLYDLDGTHGITITLFFDKCNLDYLREKFEIESKEDLMSAIYECIDTYMEM